MFQASLQISQSEFGSAVILNNNYLLTTAFNVVWAQIEELQFRVGSNSASSKGQVLNAAEVHIHPNYTGSWDYDIAVVKTDKLISFSKKAKPIKIATTELKAKTAAKVIGWGETTYESNTTSKFLQVGDVTVLDHTQCAKTYNSDLTDRLMCTLDKKQGPCEYDFGDPLVANTQLYGLFAGGYDCKPGNPVLYTDIPNLSSWVNSIVPSTQH
ncbi:trypsin delta-like [Macrosteles quadrilineatus]|uniref:trypsin delta-like n=1 Tax=Macrosteles quadrilineatus TaxID=74068 RepID=UPI0023E0E9EB|nr:trypsin delta-like [Macrosteles quadrilineatus]